MRGMAGKRRAASKGRMKRVYWQVKRRRETRERVNLGYWGSPDSPPTTARGTPQRHAMHVPDATGTPRGISGGHSQ
jgi:hypothetical protein